MPRTSKTVKAPARPAPAAPHAERRARAAKKTPKPAVKSRKARKTQAERTAMSHAGLLRATLELVAERGIRATSLQAIGERAGYSRGLAGHRFGSKEGLLRELIAENIAGFQAEVAHRIDKRAEGTQAFKALAKYHVETMEQRPEAARAYYMLLFESVLEMPDLRREFERIDESYRVMLAGLLRERMAKGAVRGDIDPGTHATLYLAMLRGVALQWVVDPTRIDLRATIGALETWLDATLTPRGPRKRG